MKSGFLATLRDDPPLAAAAIVALVGFATIGGFFFFEYGMGLPPCPLCLAQRNGYYISVPLAVLLWLGAGHGAARKVMLLGFLAIAAAMLWTAGVAVYHAGIEWKFWAGPQDCTGPINDIGSAENLLKELNRFSPIRCDVAAWRFLGLSLAGWDVPLSLALAAVALWGARASLAQAKRSG
jgi:disulfide bond formation protein DsbB